MGGGGDRRGAAAGHAGPGRLRRSRRRAGPHRRTRGDGHRAGAGVPVARRRDGPARPHRPAGRAASAGPRARSRPRWTGRLVERGRVLGLRLQTPHVLAVCRVRRPRRRGIALAAGALGDGRALVAEHGDGVVVLLPGRDASAAATDLVRRVGVARRAGPVTVGAGGPLTPARGLRHRARRGRTDGGRARSRWDWRERRLGPGPRVRRPGARRGRGRRGLPGPGARSRCWTTTSAAAATSSARWRRTSSAGASPRRAAAALHVHVEHGEPAPRPRGLPARRRLAGPGARAGDPTGAAPAPAAHRAAGDSP